MDWGKGMNQTFQGQVDTGSELIPKTPHDPLVRVGAYGGQVSMEF
jgi:hypothetical protein